MRNRKTNKKIFSSNIDSPIDKSASENNRNFCSCFTATGEEFYCGDASYGQCLASAAISNYGYWCENNNVSDGAPFCACNINYCPPPVDHCPTTFNVLTQWANELTNPGSPIWNSPGSNWGDIQIYIGKALECLFKKAVYGCTNPWRTTEDGGMGQAANSNSECSGKDEGSLLHWLAAESEMLGGWEEYDMGNYTTNVWELFHTPHTAKLGISNIYFGSDIETEYSGVVDGKLKFRIKFIHARIDFAASVKIGGSWYPQDHLWFGADPNYDNSGFEMEIHISPSFNNSGVFNGVNLELPEGIPFWDDWYLNFNEPTLNPLTWLVEWFEIFGNWAGNLAWDMLNGNTHIVVSTDIFDTIRQGWYGGWAGQGVPKFEYNLPEIHVDPEGYPDNDFRYKDALDNIIGYIFWFNCHHLNLCTDNFVDEDSYFNYLDSYEEFVPPPPPPPPPPGPGPQPNIYRYWTRREGGTVDSKRKLAAGGLSKSKAISKENMMDVSFTIHRTDGKVTYDKNRIMNEIQKQSRGNLSGEDLDILSEMVDLMRPGQWIGAHHPSHTFEGWYQDPKTKAKLSQRMPLPICTEFACDQRGIGRCGTFCAGAACKPVADMVIVDPIDGGSTGMTNPGPAQPGMHYHMNIKIWLPW